MQIGKTGTYLLWLKIMQEYMSGKEDALMLDTQVTVLDVIPHQWRYPFWDDMNRQPPTSKACSNTVKMMLCVHCCQFTIHFE